MDDLGEIAFTELFSINLFLNPIHRSIGKDFVARPRGSLICESLARKLNALFEKRPFSQYPGFQEHPIFMSIPYEAFCPTFFTSLQKRTIFKSFKI